MRTGGKNNTEPRELLVDFSSDPFVVAEMSDSGEINVLGSVPVDIEMSTGVTMHRVPNLRKNFPYITNSRLRLLCWRSIMESITALAPDDSLQMHAILPQLWRWQESTEFRSALADVRATSLLDPRGHLLSETVCIAGILAPLLGQLEEKQKREPSRLLVLCGEPDGCRHWAFDLFTSLSPALLRLREYAPSWCANPCLPNAAATGAAIIIGDQSTASCELDRSGFSGERLAGSSIVEGASRILRSFNGEAWSEEKFRLEMAPTLGWRLGTDAPEPLIESGTLLDPAIFPLPKIEREWTATSDAESLGDLSFSLEAGWGSVPESWSPLASVQVHGARISKDAQKRPKEAIKLLLEMQTPGSGTITAQVAGKPEADTCSAQFKLCSWMS